MLKDIFETSQSQPTPAAPSSADVSSSTPLTKIFNKTQVPQTAGKLTSIFGQAKAADAGVPPYFYEKFPSGATIGKSDELDTSGKPLFAYRNPGDTATTTDKTRVATTFDPTKPKALTKEEYYNPRAVDNVNKIKDILGAAHSDELDHAIALTVGGSNQPENLRAIPAAENQKFGQFEAELAKKLQKGDISYLDAQLSEAQRKGLKTPWVPPEFRNNKLSPWDQVKNYIHDFFTPKEAKAAGLSDIFEQPVKADAPIEEKKAMTDEEVAAHKAAGGSVIEQYKPTFTQKVKDFVNNILPGVKPEEDKFPDVGTKIKVPFMRREFTLPGPSGKNDQLGLSAPIKGLIEWPERIFNDIGAIKEALKGKNLSEIGKKNAGDEFNPTVGNFLGDMDSFQKNLEDNGMSSTGSHLLSGLFGTSLGVAEIIPAGQIFKNLLAKAGTNAVLTPVEHLASWEALGRPATVHEAETTARGLLIDLSNKSNGLSTPEASKVAANINKVLEVIRTKGIPTESSTFANAARDLNAFLDTDVKNISQFRPPSQTATAPFVSPAGALPGYVPENPSFVKAGLANEPVKPVGFADDTKDLVAGETDLAKIEKNVEDYVSKNKDQLVADYRAKYGNVYNVDNFKELLPGHGENRTLSEAFHLPSAKVIGDIVKEELSKPPTGENDVATFLGGATGAGKSTAIEDLANSIDPITSSKIIIDGTLADTSRSIDHIKKALSTGHRVNVLYVENSPEKILNNLIGRAQAEKNTGRTVPIETAYNTLLKSRQNLLKMNGKFGGNAKFAVRVIDNSKDVPEIVENGVDFIRKHAYSDEEIASAKATAYDVIDKLYEENKLTKEQYEGFTRRRPGKNTADSNPERQQLGEESETQLRQEETSGQLARKVGSVTVGGKEIDVVKGGTMDLPVKKMSEGAQPPAEIPSRFKNGEDIITYIAQKGTGLGAPLNITEMRQLIEYLISLGGDSTELKQWGDIQRGTVYKSYGGGTDVVLGKVKISRFGDSILVAQINKNGKLDGRFRIHGTHIEKSSVIKNLGDGGLLELSSRDKNPTPPPPEPFKAETPQKEIVPSEEISSAKVDDILKKIAASNDPIEIEDILSSDLKYPSNDLARISEKLAKITSPISVRKVLEGEEMNPLRMSREKMYALLPDNLKERGFLIEQKKEFLKENQARTLSRFQAKSGEFKGTLPEVTGKGTSEFRRRGDEIVTEKGFADSEEARQAFDEYKVEKTKLEDEEQQFNQDVRDHIYSQKLESVKELLEKSARNGKLRQFQEEASIRIGDEMQYKAEMKRLLQNEKRKRELNGNIVKRTMRDLFPLKSQDESFKKIYRKWVAKKLVAKELAEMEIQSFSKPEFDDIGSIHEFQKGLKNDFNDKIHSSFEHMYSEALNRGVDLNYRKNYLPQIWVNSKAAVEEATKKYLSVLGLSEDMIDKYLAGEELPADVSMRLKLNPFFSKARTFKTYQEGMAYGLIPKYRNMPALVASYREELEKTVANKEFLDDLLRSGKIALAEEAPEWKFIDTPFSPKQYVASPKIADFINGLFRDEENLNAFQMSVKGIAHTSRVMQEIALSGGIPFTSINFFAIGQAVKALTTAVGNAARLDLPAAASEVKAAYALVRSNSNAASANFFLKNQKYLAMMAQQGIDIGSRVGTYKNLYENLGADNAWQKVWGPLKVGFSKAFNQKTFASMMPQMYTQIFKDVYESALKAGLDEVGARLAAGDTVRAEFGIAEDMGRSKGVQEGLSAGFFAPKFRESLIGVFINAAKAFSTQFKNPAFNRSRGFVIGSIITYFLYNLLNKKLNDGKNMWENETGHELALRVPLANGEIAYVDFLPSVLGFVRALTGGTIAAAHGDFKTAGQKYGSLFSMPLKTASEVVTNSDYFGRPIYNDNDTTGTKIGKAAAYVGLATNHPYLKELWYFFQDKHPWYQSLIYATELPVKFSSLDKASQQSFYTAADELTKKSYQEKKAFTPKYEEIRSLVDQGKLDEATRMTAALSPDEYKIYQSIKSTDKRISSVRAQAAAYDTYKEVQDLIASGQKEKAAQITSKMTPAEYKTYQQLKKKFAK